ncbi:uncharacterized protein [Amphiura filiformis]|uniref:uncharacterized protein n=1 Tax=Amphiura filiformis TaxID=82378 RepID=UPI003B222325
MLNTTMFAQRILFFVVFVYVEYEASSIQESRCTCDTRDVSCSEISPPSKMDKRKDCKPKRDCDGSYYSIYLDGTKVPELCWCATFCKCEKGKGKKKATEPDGISYCHRRIATSAEPKVTSMTSTESQPSAIATTTVPAEPKVTSMTSTESQPTAIAPTTVAADLKTSPFITTRSNVITIRSKTTTTVLTTLTSYGFFPSPTSNLEDITPSFLSSKKRNIGLVAGLTCGAVVTILLTIGIAVFWKKKGQQYYSRKMSVGIYTVPDGQVHESTQGAAPVTNSAYELDIALVSTPSSEPSPYTDLNLAESQDDGYVQKSELSPNLYSRTPLPSPQAVSTSEYAIVDPRPEPSGAEYSYVDASELRRKDNGDECAKLTPKLAVGNMDYAIVDYNNDVDDNDDDEHSQLRPKFVLEDEAPAGIVYSYVDTSELIRKDNDDDEYYDNSDECAQLTPKLAVGNVDFAIVDTQEPSSSFEYSEVNASGFRRKYNDDQYSKLQLTVGNVDYDHLSH